MQDPGDGAGDVDLDLPAGRSKAVHDLRGLLIRPLGPLFAEPDRAADALFRELGVAFESPAA